MNLYVVFNNLYSGIIQSQVIDRLRFVELEFGIKYCLVVFIPIKGFWSARSTYKSKYTPVWVFPMIGGLRYWWLAFPLLILVALMYRPRKIIGRAIFATQMAIWIRMLRMSSEVVYDGRGAVAAEWEEYLGKSGWPIDIEIIKKIESNAVNFSNAQMAVSKKLVEYWQIRYGYNQESRSNLAVIPCLMSNAFESFVSKRIDRMRIIQDLNWNESDLIFLFSASKSDWQSMERFESLFVRLLRDNSNARLLVLSNQKFPLQLEAEFHNRIVKKWLKPEDVPSYSAICDYGILFRDDSITNIVASPVKVAEYLALGLKIVLTPNIGDYSEFLVSHGFGVVVDKADFLKLNHVKDAEKSSIMIRSRKILTHKAHKEELYKLFL